MRRISSCRRSRSMAWTVSRKVAHFQRPTRKFSSKLLQSPADSGIFSAPYPGNYLRGEQVGAQHRRSRSGSTSSCPACSSSTSSSPASTTHPARHRGLDRRWGRPRRHRQLRRRAARLGLRTSLATAFGDDVRPLLLGLLADDEGVDLSRSRRFPGWAHPVTVALAYDGDRALVTHGPPPPCPADELVGDPPPAARGARAPRTGAGGWPLAGARGLVFADVGWDPTRAAGPRPCSTSSRLPRVPPERPRGHGLHPHRHPARRAVEARRPGPARGRHLRRRGRHRRGRHDRRDGRGPRADRRRRGPHRRR